MNATKTLSSEWLRASATGAATAAASVFKGMTAKAALLAFAADAAAISAEFTENSRACLYDDSAYRFFVSASAIEYDCEGETVEGLGERAVACAMYALYADTEEALIESPASRLPPHAVAEYMAYFCAALPDA